MLFNNGIITWLIIIIEHLDSYIKLVSRSLSRSAQVLVKSLFRKSNCRKFFIPFSQKFLLLRSFWIMVSFSLNSSLYQIFRSWKPNFGHKSFKRVSTTGITQPDHCTCWSKVSNVLFLTARPQYVLKTYLRLSWFSQTSF